MPRTIISIKKRQKDKLVMILKKKDMKYYWHIKYMYHH